jgi:hypothetical protein
MSAHALGSRLYGCRYDRTRTFRRLAALAERILLDLLTVPRSPGIPADADFSIRVISNTVVHVEVGGLSDEFIFADYTDTKYSTPAISLRERIMQFVETYNWSNKDDLRDRRFIPSVRLLAEREYRSIFWTPGEVRIA